MLAIEKDFIVGDISVAISRIDRCRPLSPKSMRIAVCPAALGMGFHLGPQGSIEPCPPLSIAAETIHDNSGDLFATINQSEFLRGFQDFVKQRTRGCVILEHPHELVEYFRSHAAEDYSGRDLLAEIDAGTERTSHHLPGEEIPEDYWVYRILKKQLFFGMGGYG